MRGEIELEEKDRKNKGTYYLFVILNVLYLFTVLKNALMNS